MNRTVFTDALQKTERGEYADISLFANGREYIRRFLASERLIIFGGGHIAVPLCRLAAMLGFSVTVADDRPMFANTQRFPDADTVICDSFDNAVKFLSIRSCDYVCILTRGHRYDKLCLCSVLKGEIPSYMGMIGSHRRVSGLIEQLKGEGYDPDLLNQLHAPIGLSIGAVTPEEIAVSIVAELIQHRRTLSDSLPDNILPQMNTDRALLRYLAAPDKPTAMLCVLSAAGSTPVKGGAMMAVNIEGTQYGTIGGGCGEAEGARIARSLIGTGDSRIVELDMTNDVAEEDGMVCGGKMRVLIEDITC